MSALPSFCGVCGSDIGHGDNCSAGYEEARAQRDALLAALEEAAPDWLPETNAERVACIRDCAVEFSVRLGRARAAIAAAKGTR